MKAKLQSLLRLILSLLRSEASKHVFHTFWQAAGGVLLTGLFAAHSSHDVRVTLTAAFAAGLAAVKAFVVSRQKSSN